MQVCEEASLASGDADGSGIGITNDVALVAASCRWASTLSLGGGCRLEGLTELCILQDFDCM